MAIGTDFPNMLQAIHTYAARNDNLHNPINNLIAEGNFPQIATTLCNDLAELENIMPVDMGDEEQFMRAVLLELRDSWFEIPTWLPKKALIAEWEATRTAAHKKVAGQAVQAQAIANGAKKRLDALNDEDQLVSQLSVGTPSDTLPAPGPISEKKTSEQLNLTASSRKKAWETIQKTRTMAMETFRTSLEIQKECNRVVSQYKDSFGTSSPPPASSSEEKPPK